MTLFSLTYQWPHFPKNTEELLFGQLSEVKDRTDGLQR